MARQKTDYPGVYFREVRRIGGKPKEKERVYYITFKKDGKTIEEKVGRQYVDDMTPSRAAGIRAERIEGKRLSRKQLREQQEAEKQAEKDKWTISKLWEQYKVSNPNLKGKVTDENRFEKHLKKPFGDKEPKELVPLDLSRVRIKLSKKHKPATVKNVFELLRRIINFGVNQQLCEGLSFKITMPKVNNEKTEDLTPEQLSALLKAINADSNLQAANFMRLILYTGMRRGEGFRLKWQDIDFERGFITLRDPKGGVNQKIPINDAARELLENHPATKDSEYVFPGRKGGQRVDIKKQVNRIKKKAKLPKDFRALHGLRHVYASMLASSGKVDLYTLQKLLTHKSPQLTQRYAHIRDEALKNAANVAGNIIEEIGKLKEEAQEDDDNVLDATA